jgi:hypothetical protein
LSWKESTRYQKSSKEPWRFRPTSQEIVWCGHRLGMNVSRRNLLGCWHLPFVIDHRLLARPVRPVVEELLRSRGLWSFLFHVAKFVASSEWKQCQYCLILIYLTLIWFHDHQFFHFLKLLIW